MVNLRCFTSEEALKSVNKIRWFVFGTLRWILRDSVSCVCNFDALKEILGK